MIDNTHKFSGKGKIYDKSRPSYPNEMVDYLYNQLGFCKDSAIADIGSGTGKLSKLLLDKGSIVYGVEPNKDMRNLAESSFSAYKNYHSIDAPAENIDLPSNSVDFVTVAQAFHWFDHKAFKIECKRILRQSGRVVLIWNRKNTEQAIQQATNEVYRNYCSGYLNRTGGLEEIQDIIGDFFDYRFEHKIFKNELVFDRDSFVSMHLSQSYAPLPTDSHYLAVTKELQNIYVKYQQNGLVYIDNYTNIYYNNR